LLLFARHACKIHVQELGEKILWTLSMQKSNDNYFRL
jgi:hypothetical protein